MAELADAQFFGSGTVKVWGSSPFARTTTGNNSVVECKPCKVYVAGSNPVSRSAVTLDNPGGFYFTIRPYLHATSIFYY